jgi:hypothetical protein
MQLGAIYCLILGDRNNHSRAMEDDGIMNEAAWRFTVVNFTTQAVVPRLVDSYSHRAYFLLKGDSASRLPNL